MAIRSPEDPDGKLILLDFSGKDKDVTMDNIAIETSSQEEDNGVDDYSHFKTDSEEEVEETQFQKEQASLSEGEASKTGKNTMDDMDFETEKVLTQDQKLISDVNNLYPRGLDGCRFSREYCYMVQKQRSS
nr:uncharacterized protein LOC104098156 [Nicotiana tomentosiformis]